MNDQRGITDDLSQAVDELQASLTSAADAAARIKTLLPHVARISSVFNELESIMEAGRQTAGVAEATPIAAPPPAPRPRPTLVAPSATPQRPLRPKAAGPLSPATKSAERTLRAEAAGTPPPPAWTPAAPIAASAEPSQDRQSRMTNAPAGEESASLQDIPAVAAATEPMTSFRLEFESTQGPLDLRAVDDAVSEHPAVRDVALLDYDGRRATLKVWITAEASVADVQQALTARAAQLAAPDGNISIIALEDVA